jgi:lipoprotein-anchoring transpeptidase ErfK/SrfK
VGELHVAVIVPNPNYSFDPEIFPESAEARELGRKLILPPGPNNPVGTVWIGLDRPGYGIHGSPRPEEVGRTQSHGCFRLANWNAEYLLQLVRVGTPVFVMP